MRSAEVLQGLHRTLGLWYWFILVGLFFVTLHTTDHVAAAIIDKSPLGSTIIGEQNAEGFVLWHGGLTVLDYSMTLVLVTLIYRRWEEPSLPALGRPALGIWRPVQTLRKLHRALGDWYWFVAGALIFISVHTFDHIIAIIFNTSPLSDTIVANSINHTGFILWHSLLTLVDYAMTLLLLSLLYSRWMASLPSASLPGPPDSPQGA